jgi:uncharacterized protein (DUF362 family)
MTNTNKKFYITKWTAIDKKALTTAIDTVEVLGQITRGTRVFIKPNFTFPFFKPGVTTPPDLIRSLVEILVERTDHITIGEGGPSLDVFDIRDSFDDHGLYDLKDKFGINITDLRDEKVVYLQFGRNKASRKVPIPTLLVEDTDLYITLPVAKVHAMTTVSLATKNQWGCIAAKKRFLFHPAFNEIVVGIHKLIQKQLVICDGRYVLTDNGPMFGTVRKGGFLSCANDIGSFDVAMCRLMGFNPNKIGHIRAMAKHGLAPKSLDEISHGTDPAYFRPCTFELKRTMQNYIALSGFHSSLIAWFGYDSFASKFLHKILYAIKPNPLTKEIREKNGK